MKIFFIADTHFDDDNLRRYENRPFESTRLMNEALVANWNSVVGEEDLVYHLGDVGNLSFLKELKGRKRLIKGNHDLLLNEEYRQAGFEEVYDLPVILDGYFILSHNPLYVNRNMPYANIFGHVHANPEYRLYSERSHNVSADVIDFTPIEYDLVKKRISEADRLASEST